VGLCTGNIYSPFPEEVSRRPTTPLVALDIASPKNALANKDWLQVSF
jgi:UDP-N-acetylglucosamine 2-epimerase